MTARLCFFISCCLLSVFELFAEAIKIKLLKIQEKKNTLSGEALQERGVS